MNEHRKRRAIATGPLQTGGAFAVFDDGSADEVFVEGVASMDIGPSFTRLRCFVTDYSEFQEGSTNLNQERLVKLNLVMPTPALLEFIKAVPETVKPIGSLISKANDLNMQYLDEIINKG